MEQTLIIMADTPSVTPENDIMAKLRAAGLLDILIEANRLAELNPEMDVVVYHDSPSAEEFLSTFYAALDKAELAISRHLRKYFDNKLILKNKPILDMPQLIYSALNNELAKEDVEKAVLINCSCPMLLGELIDDAFYYIDYFHLVLGGIKGGGIYLIATDEAPKALLESGKWSADTTGKELAATAEAMELATRQLDTLHAIQTVEDMKNIYPNLLENGTAPRTCEVWQRFGESN